MADLKIKTRILGLLTGLCIGAIFFILYWVFQIKAITTGKAILSPIPNAAIIFILAAFTFGGIYLGIALFIKGKTITQYFREDEKEEKKETLVDSTASRYCPQCKSDYREGVTVCSDCGVDLIAYDKH